jgi:hypothetical protein
LIKNGKFKNEVKRTLNEKKRLIEKRKKRKYKAILKDEQRRKKTALSTSRRKADNKVNPVEGLKKMDTLTQNLNRNNISEAKIDQDMENSLYIRNWEDLFDLYMNKIDFSSDLLFDFAFRTVILWKFLVRDSKRHRARFEEIQNESKGIIEFDPNFKNSSPYQKEVASIFYFIDKIMVNIEVNDSSENHLQVYFPRRPECFMLADQDKKSYKEECDISDANTKMLHLMRNFNMFSIQMEGNLKSYRMSPILYRILSKDAFAYYNIIAWVMGLIINILMALVLVRYDNQDLRASKKKYEKWLKFSCFGLSCFAGFCLVLWLIFRYLQRCEIMKEDFKFDNPAKDPERPINKLYINVKKALLEAATPVNMSLHIFFTLYGFYYSKFFLSLNLLLIANISRTTKFVVKAITLHWDQLVLTLVLTLFVIYSYTILLSEYYYGTLDLGDEDLDLCRNLYECFMYTVNWGLRNGGGIADSMTVEPKGAQFYQKNIYDVSFFIFVNVIALNIIFGIIIDTFSEMRDEQHERGKFSSLAVRFGH